MPAHDKSRPCSELLLPPRSRVLCLCCSHPFQGHLVEIGARQTTSISQPAVRTQTQVSLPISLCIDTIAFAHPLCRVAVPLLEWLLLVHLRRGRWRGLPESLNAVRAPSAVQCCLAAQQASVQVTSCTTELRSTATQPRLLGSTSGCHAETDLWCAAGSSFKSRQTRQY